MGVRRTMKNEEAALRLAAANGHRMGRWQQGDSMRWSSCLECRMPVADDGHSEPFGPALYRVCPKESEYSPEARSEKPARRHDLRRVILLAIKVIRDLM